MKNCNKKTDFCIFPESVESLTNIQSCSVHRKIVKNGVMAYDLCLNHFHLEALHRIHCPGHSGLRARDETEFPFPVKGGKNAPISLPFPSLPKKRHNFLPISFPTLVTSVNSFPFPSHNSHVFLSISFPYQQKLETTKKIK